MRILQIMKWLSPYQNVGGKIRCYGLGQALSSFAEVDALGCLSSGEGVCGNENHLACYQHLHTLNSGNKFERYSSFLFAVSQGTSLRTARFATRSIKPFLSQLLEKGHYDFLQLEELPMMSLLAEISGDIPIVFSTHNAESRLSADIFRHRNPFFRLLANMEKKRSTAEERRALSRANAWISVSQQDQDTFNHLCPQSKTPHVVLPNCAQDRFKPSLNGTRCPSEILCMGALGWHPNRHGLDWFIEAVLPLLKKECPEFTIRIVGSGIDHSLQKRLERLGFHVHANVPDVLPFLQQARLLIVPLKVGGGSRIKIVEAWAAGLPVVSTGIGASGLSVRPGSDLLMADPPSEFARSIHRLLTDHDLHHRLHMNGLEKACDLRWSKQGPVLKTLYDKINRAGTRS